MIISWIRGGLGNQLFQYAFGRRSSYINEVPHKLDISAFENYKLRKYKLNHFNIIEDIATPKDVHKFRKRLLLPDIVKPRHERLYVKERGRQFDATMVKVSDRAYLKGFWQCEEYFKDIEDIIRNEFTLKNKPDAPNEHMSEEIRRGNSVSIHVRRGDYLTNPKSSRLFGTCSTDYYHCAMGEIAEKITEPCFFVFSDDLAWARDNLVTKHSMTYVDINTPDKDYADLWLMSQCRHHIIANSSFSWWGAWLCKNRDKIVIAPRKWFNFSEKKNYLESRDRVPKAWLRL